MRFAINFSPAKALRLPRNLSDWPLALRFALLVVPLGLCVAVMANWLGYRAASVSLRDALSSLSMLEAKIQALAMHDTLERLRLGLVRVAHGNGAHDAEQLRQTLALFFDDTDNLISEAGFIDSGGNSFVMLRDNEGIKTLDAVDASSGPYSPFKQINAHTHESGRAALHPPVFFDDPGVKVQRLDARAPVMRMSLPLDNNRGILFLGLNLASLRNKIGVPRTLERGLRLPAHEDATQLSFFFDIRGWILFEMSSINGGYSPDVAREGYSGDLGRAGYDTAFRPWTSHENYWHMVTDIADGRSGSTEVPVNKYFGAYSRSEGFLCYAPVFFSSAENAEAQIIGGIAFFGTSSLPLAAFLRYANYAAGGLLGAALLFALAACVVGRKLAHPLSKMAEKLDAMTEDGNFSLINTPAAYKEQQKIQAAINTLIAGVMASRSELKRLAQAMHAARARLPADLSQPLPNPLPKAEFGLVGSSDLITEVRDHVHKAAKAGTDVLVWGETGTGKELVAAAIHKAGKRPDSAYISINCGALDENLLLDALFGHVRGAFSGAKGDRKGAFLAANEGTLHLDEIANASLKVQQALLRALSVRRIRPLGTDEEIPFTTRIVAATNVDLRECVKAGTFREDLYFRLAIISVKTPPLRHRKEDIPELAAYCIHEAAKSLGRPEARLSRGALDIMVSHNWPGNVREFKNCLTRAMAYVDGELILPQHITLEPETLRDHGIPAEPGALAKRFRPSKQGEDKTNSYQEYGHAAGETGAAASTGTGVTSLPVYTPDLLAPPYAENAAHTPGGLNERQLRAISFIRQYGEITRPEYENVAGQGVSSRTAQNDLRDLVERGLIARVGAGPGTRYIGVGKP